MDPCPADTSEALRNLTEFDECTSPHYAERLAADVIRVFSAVP